ncbi:MAG TPA: hypothetical protein VMZ28_03870 [Kofleriaceae bacterium]|nr:hypothetical protein [Kofleriaceae bacterium]
MAHADLLIGGVLALAGWAVVLGMNRWWVTAPVVFLCIGWGAILLAARALWRSAQSAGGETGEPDDAMSPLSFEVFETKADELEREKRALLKAIKEVEFDREMGKMTEEDASEIVKVYRARAIEILKELDEGAPGAASESVKATIEKELRARLALAGVKGKKKKKPEPEAPT